MEIEYRAGGRMQHVDAFSRNPIMLIGVTETDWFVTVQLQDPTVQEIVAALKAGNADRDIRENYRIVQGRLYRITVAGDRLFVPRMARFNLVRKHHDDIGHPGFERCLKLVQATYWFPRMRRFIDKYVKSCLNCAYGKGNYGRGEGYLHPIKRRPIPMDTVHVDHLGPFMRSTAGNSYLLVLIDGFTKFVWARPTKTLRSTEAITNLREILGDFGYPRRIISDRGLAFRSNNFVEFLKEKGIRHVKNAIATPRANGQVERINRTLIEALTVSSEDEAHWDQKLPEILWGINNTVNASTRFSPASLMFSHKQGVVADLNGDFRANEQANGDGETIGVGAGDHVQAGAMHANGESHGAIYSTVGEATREGALEDNSIGTEVAGREGDCSVHPGLGVVAGAAGLQSSEFVALGPDVSTQRAAGQQGDSNSDPGHRSEIAAGSRDDDSDDLGQLAGEMRKQLCKRRQEASDKIGETACNMKARYDKKRKVATKFKAGDLVLWRQAATNTSDPGTNRKLANRFDGPYKVSKALGNDRYQIQAIKGVRGYKRFSAIVAVDSLRRYHSCNDGGSDSGEEGEIVDRQDLIDLLES